MKRCPTIEKWKKEGILETIPSEKLAIHWKECNICQENLQELKKLDLHSLGESLNQLNNILREQNHERQTK